MYFSHLGVFSISVKPLTTENTENKTTPKICKITLVHTKWPPSPVILCVELGGKPKWLPWNFTNLNNVRTFPFIWPLAMQDTSRGWKIVLRASFRIVSLTGWDTGRKMKISLLCAVWLFAVVVHLQEQKGQVCQAQEALYVWSRRPRTRCQGERIDCAMQQRQNIQIRSVFFVFLHHDSHGRQVVHGPPRFTKPR